MGNLADVTTTASTSYALILAAEMGDKSQLVCMALASRYRAFPVLLGAIIAFALLNTLAVVFGVAIASWFPSYIISATVAVLFFFFGLHSLVIDADDDDEIIEKKGANLFFSTFLLITLAELGDKTQLAVVALSSSTLPVAVWLGATAALATTSALGVLAGRTILQKIPMTLLHRFSGSLFLIFALVAAYNSYLNYTV
ncbi:MAG: TMEM165/GDT1 family protein [Methylococcales bacterium]|nr:TMEM165/GDT1 family protein [Methylococcales bacterium]